MSNVGKASKYQVKVPEMEARLANLRNHKKLMGLELCKQEKNVTGIVWKGMPEPGYVGEWFSTLGSHKIMNTQAFLQRV